MSGLATLLRLARRRAEERRLALVATAARREAAEAALLRQDSHMAGEAAGLGQDALSQADWASWQRAAMRHRTVLAAEAGAARAAEEAAREGLREAVAEAKRMELALAAAEQALRRQAARRREAAAEDAELRRPRTAQPLG